MIRQRDDAKSYQDDGQGQTHYRGSWCDPEVMDFLKEGKINHGEFALFFVIDSLCNPDKGCWAGNDFLAEQINQDSRSVRRHILRLREVGLIVEIQVPSQSNRNKMERRLVTAAWTYSKKGRAFMNVEDNRVQGVGQECPGGRTTVSRDEDTGVHRVERVVDRVKHSMSSPAGLDGESEGKTSVRQDSNSNGKQNNPTPSVGNNGDSKNKSKRKKKEPSSFDRRAALELKKVIEAYEPIKKSANVKSWPNQIRLMREADEIPKDDIKRALLWYKDYIGKEYMPEIFGGKSFREKYEKLTRAMKRVGNKTETQKQNDPASTPGHADRVSRVWKYFEDENWIISGGCPERHLIRDAMKALGMEEGSIDFDKF